MSEKEGHGLRYKIGLLLLFLHIIIGDAFGYTLSALSVKTGHEWMLKAGIICYGSSWVIGGVGAILAGPEGVQAVKDIWHHIFRRK
ncbi:MAG: hypothetical protein ABRQ37_10325 [Candidatus Eremiobacterota bacterium]